MSIPSIDSIFNYSSLNLRKEIVDKEGFGSYLIVDNFLDQDFFEKLTTFYNTFKKSEKSKFKGNAIPRIGRHGEPLGQNFLIGGAGSQREEFKIISQQNEDWENFLDIVYSKESKNYFLNIFSNSKAYEDCISKEDIEKSIIGCKVSSQTNNYADIIHPDATAKVISYLLYLDNSDWEKDSEGGTDFWEVTDNFIDYSKDKNSLESKLREGKNLIKPASLRKEDAEKVRKFLSVKFKPNRLVGFVRTDTSYHSIPPRVLPNGVTRDCFQINLWNFNRKEKWTISMRVKNSINYRFKQFKTLPKRIYYKLNRNHG